MASNVTDNSPLDLWLRFDDPENDYMAEAEANTCLMEDGTYRVEWYLNSVGLVKGVEFETLEEAHGWLVDEGFEDYSS